MLHALAHFLEYISGTQIEAEQYFLAKLFNFLLRQILRTFKCRMEEIASEGRLGKKIHFLCIIAAPEGLKKLQEAHPDIDIYVGALDSHLNENAYIVPGLGDAGDRIFGTK